MATMRPIRMATGHWKVILAVIPIRLARINLLNRLIVLRMAIRLENQRGVRPLDGGGIRGGFFSFLFDKNKIFLKIYNVLNKEAL